MTVWSTRPVVQCLLFREGSFLCRMGQVHAPRLTAPSQQWDNRAALLARTSIQSASVFPQPAAGFRCSSPDLRAFLLL